VNAAQPGKAVFSALGILHDPDLVFRRKKLPGCTANILNHPLCRLFGVLGLGRHVGPFVI